jgi:hypothetical protein
MTIRIVCENETGYDPTTGTFTYCDHAFTCDDSLLAKVTRCPKCQNSIRVGTSHRHVWADSGQPVADPNAVKQHARQLAAKERAAGNGNGNGKGTASGKAAGNGNGKDALPPAPADPTAAPQAAAHRDRQSPAKRGSAQGQSTATNVASPRGAKTAAGVSASHRPERPTPIKCYNCGTLLVELQPKCPSCLADLTKPAGMVVDSLKIKNPVGFHRWLFTTAFAGVKPMQLTLGFNGFLLAFVAAIYRLLALSVEPTVLLYVSIGFGVVLLLYAYVFYCCHRACTDLAYPLRWWQRAFWLWVLYFARQRNWSYDPADEGNRPILDMREKNINDLTLVQLENLTQCEVLDIAGCPVSDRGTKPLHFLRHLRCLVLVGTGITHEEVGRLQRSLPNCWIWH